MQGWTDERVELLKKLWAEGLSASQIAAQLGGVTRNAVIGKVHRLGLSGRAKAVAAVPRANKMKVRPAPAAARPGPQPLVLGATALKVEPDFEPDPLPQPVAGQTIAFPAPAAEQRITILQLSDKTCRWPEGDPASPNFRFCGSGTATGLPYCSYHCSIAYQPSVDRRRDRRLPFAR